MMVILSRLVGEDGLLSKPRCQAPAEGASTSLLQIQGRLYHLGLLLSRICSCLRPQSGHPLYIGG